MPVIARFCGIVIRMLYLPLLGLRLHAFHGDAEMVVDLSSLRILENTVPEHVRLLAMAWIKEHQRELLAGAWGGAPRGFA